MHLKDKISQRGASIYFSMIILSIMLAIALGLAIILINQTRMIKSMGDSVAAFYAAETGVEIILYRDTQCRISNPCNGFTWACAQNCFDGIAGTESPTPGNIGGASYSVTFDEGANWIESTGECKDSKRAVRVDR